MWFLAIHSTGVGKKKAEIKTKTGRSLAVQWLRLHTCNAGGDGWIPGWGLRSHILYQWQKKCFFKLKFKKIIKIGGSSATGRGATESTDNKFLKISGFAPLQRLLAWEWRQRSPARFQQEHLLAHRFSAPAHLLILRKAAWITERAQIVKLRNPGFMSCCC